MAIVTAMIPAGFGPEKKARFISETKNALCEAFDLIPMAISLWVQEYEPENMCPDAAKKRVLIVYTTEGKPDEQKNKVGQLFDQVCGDVFGEQKGDTFVIFKEHPNSNVCAPWCTEDHGPKAPHQSLSQPTIIRPSPGPDPFIGTGRAPIPSERGPCPSF